MLSELLKGWYFSEGGGGGSADSKADPEADPNAQAGDGGEVLEWDTWHKALPEPAQQLIAQRESGLKTALASERDARKTAEKDLRDVAAKLEKGSEAQNEVIKLADAVAEGTAKADFYEEAHKAGVSNLKLAYHVASTEGFMDKRGNANFDKMKEQYPELFGRKAPPPSGNAGDGTGTAPTGKKKDMNTFIRTVAGKQ